MHGIICPLLVDRQLALKVNKRQDAGRTLEAQAVPLVLVAALGRSAREGS
jgi:hypothetical protein